MAAERTPETERLSKIVQALEARNAPQPIEYWIERVGEGWRPLVLGLDANIREIAPDYVIGQVKEKFGGLRYYLDACPDDAREEVMPLIRAAEELSYKTCEDCGAAGEAKSMNGFWVKTLCPLHHRKRAAKNN